MSNKLTEIIHPLKYTFGYATGFIFILGIMIYIYLLIVDHKEDSNKHSLEETVWIYLFLAILIMGFIISYYTITCSIYCVNKPVVSSYSFGFGGSKLNIASRPSGGHNIIRSTNYIV